MGRVSQEGDEGLVGTAVADVSRRSSLEFADPSLRERLGPQSPLALRVVAGLAAETLGVLHVTSLAPASTVLAAPRLPDGAVTTGRVIRGQS